MKQVPLCPHCESELVEDPQSFSFYCDNPRCIINLEKRDRKGDLEDEKKYLEIKIGNLHIQNTDPEMNFSIACLILAAVIYIDVRLIINSIDPVESDVPVFVCVSFLVICNLGAFSHAYVKYEEYAQANQEIRVCKKRLKEVKTELSLLEKHVKT